MDGQTDRPDEQDREQNREQAREGGVWRPPAGPPAPAATAERQTTRPAADEQLSVPEDREAAAAAEERAGERRPPAVVERLELLGAEDLRGYRRRWEMLQAAFVDDPAGATEQADALVGELIGRLSRRQEALRDELRRRPDGGADTEARRQALRQYRTFFLALVGD
jgi:hypothetical protein